MGSAMLKGWLADPGLNAKFTIIEPHADHLGWAEPHQQVAIYSDCDAAIAVGPRVNAPPSGGHRASGATYRRSWRGQASIMARVCSVPRLAITT